MLDQLDWVSWACLVRRAANCRNMSGGYAILVGCETNVVHRVIRSLVMLTVHRAERADALLGPLAELLLTAAGDVFDPEIIAVPTRGVERWLAQQLALTLGAGGAGDGMAANIDSPVRQHLSMTCWRSPAGLPPRDPWLGTAWSAVCCPCWTHPRGSRGVRSSTTTSAPADRRDRIGAAGGFRRRRRSRGCSPPTPTTGRPCWWTGRRVATPMAPGMAPAMRVAADAVAAAA